MESNTKVIVDLKKMEEQIVAARESAKAQFLVAAQDALMNLKAIGFNYELVEKNGTGPKMGRPKKEAKNGVAVV